MSYSAAVVVVQLRGSVAPIEDADSGSHTLDCERGEHRELHLSHVDISLDDRLAVSGERV